MVGSARYTEFVIFLTLAAAAALLAYIYREDIVRWMRRRHTADTSQDKRDRMSL
jgi:hypothetical protein